VKCWKSDVVKCKSGVEARDSFPGRPNVLLPNRLKPAYFTLRAMHFYTFNRSKGLVISEELELILSYVKVPPM
jgi:hypothetical protein